MQSLSKAIRGAEEDTTILFTQFIKLLLNDANYLLDEALHNLEEVCIALLLARPVLKQIMT